MQVSASAAAISRFCSTKRMATPPFANAFHRIDEGADNADGETRRRLVKQHHLRIGHQRAPDRQHLLLAAGERTGELLAPLRKPGKKLVDDLRRNSGPATRGVAAGEQCLLHGKIRKQLAPLRHQRQAGDARRCSARAW